MNKNYIKPAMVIHNIQPERIIASSDDEYYRENRYICGNSCKFWHICRDRETGKFCSDKEYK